MKNAILLTLMAVSGQAAAAQECRPLAGFSLCGEWAQQGDALTVTGDATIETDGVTLSLPAAELAVTLEPPAFIGEVDFVLPAFGPLAGWGVEGSLPRAQIQMGMGAGLDAVEIGGEPLTLVDDEPYLVVDIDSNVSLSVGGVTASASVGSSTKVVIAPLDPLIYLEGEVVRVLTQGIVEDGAVGVSLHGMLPWSSSLELFDGEDWGHRDVSAHLYASGGVQLGQYPVYVSSTVAIDLDPDGDGAFSFSRRGGTKDVRVGVNGQLALGWEKGIVSLTLPVGDGSVVYDTQEGLLMVHGELDMNPFSGTPLAPLFTGVEGGSLWGHYASPNDYSVHIETDALTLGFPTSELEMTLTDESLIFGGLLEPQYGDVFGDQSVRFTGRLNGQGQFRLEGTANLNLGGLPLANAELTWTNTGLTVRGVVDIPGGVGEAMMEGSLQTNGQFSLTGSTDFSPLGLPMAASTVTMTNSGFALAGRMAIPTLGEVAVHGEITANGSFELAGVADIEVFGLPLSDAEITVRNGGIEIDASLKVPGLSAVRVQGMVGLDGDFSLSGEADLAVKGFELASAQVEFSRNGVHIEGRIDALIAEGRVTGSYRTSASIAHQMGMSLPQYTQLVQMYVTMFGFSPLPKPGLYLGGNMAVEIPVPGPNITLSSASISVSDSGVRAKGKVNFHGVRVQVSGSVKSSGSVSLKGDAGFDASVGGTGVKGDLTVTATDTKLSGKVSAKACVNVFVGKVCKSASASVSSTGRVSLNMPSPVPDINFNLSSVF